MFISSFYPSSVKPQAFEINLGENVRVISDKAYRRSAENLFEAVGNVIITHDPNAIYGEKATLGFETGDADVFGNVRYVGPEMTMYGSELHYNFQTDFLKVKNARIVSDGYVVLGSEIWRDEPGEIRAINAEYTTCEDCPESWSIVGGEVHITQGEYIRITHAFIKVRGVVVMYIPYLVLPIKKDRETGLLFPSMSARSDEGIHFRQPFFWAINDHQDMTLTPSFFGKRGFGGDVEYRQVLGERRWFQLNSLAINDLLYDPNDYLGPPDERTRFRHFSEYEHHYQFSNNLNHHLFFSQTRDLDIMRDFDYLLQEKQKGSDLGGGGFFDWRRHSFNVFVESYYMRNQLTGDALEFDDDYVQILPKIGFNLVPMTLIDTDIPGFRRWSFDIEGDYTVFTQNKTNEEEFIRNAQRFNLNPRIDIDLFNVGPARVTTRSTFDYQYYHFPEQDRLEREDEKRHFSKFAHIQETEMSFELEKIFGLSYRERVPRENLISDQEDKESSGNYLALDNMIGKLPRFDPSARPDEILVRSHSYRHSQIFRLRHFYLFDERTSGSERFLNQIDNDRGHFDNLDALRRTQHLRLASNRRALPLSNTLELQWNNSLIRKRARSFDPFEDSRYLRDNFSYSRMAFFNVSQGYNLDAEGDALRERLTRLYINTGFNIGRTSFRLREYYFYETQDHLFSISLRQRFDYFNLGASLVYDSFTRPSDKRLAVNTDIKLSDLIELRAVYDFDLEDRKEVLSRYGVTYAPRNNCWKLDLSYERSLVDKRVSLNFLINFGDNTFHSVSGN